MNAFLVGEQADSIADLVTSSGIKIVEKESKSADFCICYGGDGTLLGAERDFPGLPKVPIRKRTNNRSAENEFRLILERVVSKSHSITLLPKLLVTKNGLQNEALNDVVLHNSRVVSAVRFRVEVDGLIPFQEIIGDGLVLATPFGSSAYYRAITNSVIHVGLGLAFNNSTESVNHLVISEEAQIKIIVTRGPAVLAVDNNPDVWTVSDGDIIECKISPNKSEIWEINNLLCMENLSTGDSSRRLRWLEPK
ncbi:MAG: hypothetical protein ACFCU1_11525 [Sumerlaeia bacterium]